jgi:hypothetical protein
MTTEELHAKLWSLGGIATTQQLGGRLILLGSHSDIAKYHGPEIDYRRAGWLTSDTFFPLFPSSVVRFARTVAHDEYVFFFVDTFRLAAAQAATKHGGKA